MIDWTGKDVYGFELMFGGGESQFWSILYNAMCSLIYLCCQDLDEVLKICFKLNE